MIEDIEQLVEQIRVAYPEWSSFDDQRFLVDEVDYKKKSITKAHEQLSKERMEQLIQHKEFDAIIKSLDEVGKDNNLLWRSVPTSGDLNILYHSFLDKGEFSKVVFDLFYGDGRTEERLDRYVGYLNERKLPNKWTFPTYFLFLLHPEFEFFVKPLTIAKFLRFVGEPGLSSSPSGSEYGRLKSIMATMKDRLKKYEPEDMVDIQSFVWIVAQRGQDRVVSKDRSVEFQKLFSEFVNEYLITDEGKEHMAARVDGRNTATENWKEVQAEAEKGHDITDLVLLKLLPYVDSQSNRSQGAWIHIAPSITGDLRRWYESTGWVKSRDWPQIAKMIYGFVKECVEAPNRLADACKSLQNSPFSKGFQQGMLTPILNSLQPDLFLLVNNKSRGVANYLTNNNFGQNIGEYPEVNTLLKKTINDLENNMDIPSGIEALIEDMFDTFCHWMVAIRKHPLRHTRYWKIAPGEDAWNWENSRNNGYITMGWDELGDVSKMDRTDFRTKVDELVKAHPEWTKVRLEQVWKFSRIREGDVIIANKGTSEILGIGIVNGDYYFVPGERHGHRLPVLWEDTKIRHIKEGGWRRTLIELNRTKFEDLLELPVVASISPLFTRATFDLLSELHDNPTRAFYNEHRAQFKKSVEAPLQSILLQAAELLPESMRIVLETKTGLFSRILKNDFGHGGAWDYYWGALYPKGGKRIEASQLYALIDRNIIRYGFSLGDYSATHRERFLSNWRKHGEALRTVLRPYLENEEIVFGATAGVIPDNEASLSRWLEDPEKTGLNAAVFLTADQASHKTPGELASDISRVFQILFPLILISISDEPLTEIQSFLEPEEETEVVVNPEYPLSQMIDETFLPEEEVKRWVTSVERKKHAIFYGPPGTGKTYVARLLAAHLIGGGDGFSELVQFHPSYAYEDFLQGIRPRTTVDGALSYALQDGVFKRFCDRARAKSGKCVLIIDEINRANLSRVFGELMYLMEYREQTIPLAYGGTFEIPDNVYLLGTMNTADRSIALVDHALRRRFAFIRLSSNYDILRNYHQETGYEVDGLISVLQDVNRDIGEEDYHLGMSYFLTQDLTEHIEDIWRMEIEPYLEEYFFDHRDKAQRYRWDKVKSRIVV